jgi:chromosome transmission fidelity protein 18
MISPMDSNILTMHRPIDTLTAFHMGKSAGMLPAPIRYAVRQVLDQEHRKETLLRLSNARQARSAKLDVDNSEDHSVDKENADPLGKHRRAAPCISGVKRDFFGRTINDSRPVSAGGKGNSEDVSAAKDEESRVWISFHEGYSNAVRKPLTLRELLESF